MFKKVLLGLLLVILAAGGLATYWLYNEGESFLELYIEEQIEARGSEALGVSVDLDGFDLDLNKRIATFTDFKIGNPDGFDDPNAFKVSSITVELGDISRDLIIVEKLNVEGVRANYTAQAGGSNITQMRENLERQQSQNAAQESNEAFKMPNVIIENFYFEGAKVKPKVNVIAGRGIGKDINLSEIKLEGIGREENGIKIGEALSRIMQPINSRIRTAVARAGLFEGLTQVALMGVTGGIPIIGVTDEILGLIGIGEDDDDDDGYYNARREPKTLSETLNN